MFFSFLIWANFTLAESISVEQAHWSLQKILLRAEERTPAIQALSKDIEKAENIARQVGRWGNPNFTISYGPMTQVSDKGHSLDVSFKQDIPLFGQKAVAEQVGQQNKMTIEIESHKKLLSIRHEVVKLAYRFAGIDEEAKHVIHRRDKINLIAKYLNTRTFPSPSQAVEKDFILNRLREIEEEFLEVSLARETAWRALNVFLDLQFRIVPDVKWMNDPQLPKYGQLLSYFQSQNPDFKRIESMMATAELEVRQAGKKQFPEFRIGGSYNEQTANLPQTIYTGVIELSLPIFDNGNYAQRAAIAEKEALNYRLAQKRRELSEQFEQAWFQLEQCKKRIKLYPTTLIPNLEAQMRKAEQNWKKGLVQVSTFLGLENQVHQQAVKVYDAQIAYINALSEIQSLAGIDFASEGNIHVR